MVENQEQFYMSLESSPVLGETSVRHLWCCSVPVQISEGPRGCCSSREQQGHGDPAHTSLLQLPPAGYRSAARSLAAPEACL